MENWVELVIAIFSGLAAAIPLVVKLVEYVRQATREKNWSAIMRLVIEYMTVAEEQFADGASRKAWVMEMIKASAAGIEYNLDEAAMEKISAMIDSICSAAKVINTEVAANTKQ